MKTHNVSITLITSGCVTLNVDNVAVEKIVDWYFSEDGKNILSVRVSDEKVMPKEKRFYIQRDQAVMIQVEEN